jgi:hypothetical protein
VHLIVPYKVFQKQYIIHPLEKYVNISSETVGGVVGADAHLVLEISLVLREISEAMG